MKNCFVFFAVLFLVSVPSFYPFTGTEVTHSTYVTNTNGVGTLQTSSFASFNDSFTQCLGTDGNYYWGNLFQTFAPVVFAPCQSQMFADFDFLSKHHINTVRLWPVLSTFAYDNSTQTWSSNFNSSIANLDKTLKKLAQDHIKAYITLMSTPDCSDPPEIGSQSWVLLQSSAHQQCDNAGSIYLGSPGFHCTLSNNPAIYGYDLVNEVSLVLANPPTTISPGYCNLPYDTGDFTKTQALLARMYATAKSADTVHSFTYSFDHLYPTSSLVFTMVSNDVDFYDIHAYSNDPKGFLPELPEL